MKGKKADLEFVSSFIEDCIANNKTTPETIIQSAREEINCIELKIKEVEDLKLRRAKLLDVIFHFRKLLISNSNEEEAKLLIFSSLYNIELCKSICLQIATSSSVDVSSFTDDNSKFTIKQLLETGIIKKSSATQLSKGSLFDAYIDYLNKKV